MTAPVRITADMLRDKRACEDQVGVFAKLFPRGTAVTLKAAVMALKVGLDVEWFARRFVSTRHRRKYRRQFDLMWGEYKLRLSYLFDKYPSCHLRAERNRQLSRLWHELDRKRAALLVAAWEKGGSR